MTQLTFNRLTMLKRSLRLWNGKITLTKDRCALNRTDKPKMSYVSARTVPGVGVSLLCVNPFSLTRHSVARKGVNIPVIKLVDEEYQ